MNQRVYLELLPAHYQCSSFEERNICQFHPLRCVGLGKVTFRFTIIFAEVARAPQKSKVLKC
jgi:hypothetical protein